jgi:hypothetical protein
MALCHYIQTLYFDYYYCTFVSIFFFVRGIPSGEILAPPLDVLMDPRTSHRLPSPLRLT